MISGLADNIPWRHIPFPTPKHQSPGDLESPFLHCNHSPTASVTIRALDLPLPGMNLGRAPTWRGEYLAWLLEGPTL